MIELASHYQGDRPVQAARIAARHGIPAQFLLQILHELKRAKLVSSTRGAAGGYRLCRPPEDVPLVSVVDVFESIEEANVCAAADSPLAPAMICICSDLAKDCRQRLASITLADLAEQSTIGAEPMWYI
jgi:Rrf2 family protein